MWIDMAHCKKTLGRDGVYTWEIGAVWGVGED
jgi:hypothetical protein